MFQTALQEFVFGGKADIGNRENSPTLLLPMIKTFLFIVVPELPADPLCCAGVLEVGLEACCWAPAVLRD